MLRGPADELVQAIGHLCRLFEPHLDQQFVALEARDSSARDRLKYAKIAGSSHPIQTQPLPHAGTL